MELPREIRIAPSVAADRDAIGEITNHAGVFSEEELTTVFELFDTYIAKPTYGYLFLSAYWEGKLAGYVCYGMTALTQGAYDMYWLCTDSGLQKRGIGQALFEAVEGEVRKLQGRLIVIWTSGKSAYMPATSLYKKMGCESSGRIRDFYEPGDDLLVFTKYL
jgi:ribosomal protein S18 acetylase RimI-like enzyme